MTSNYEPAIGGSVVEMGTGMEDGPMNTAHQTYGKHCKRKQQVAYKC